MHRRLHILVLEHNEVHEITHPVSGFESLKILSLNANRVTDWAAVDALQGWVQLPTVGEVSWLLHAGLAFASCQSKTTRSPLFLRVSSSR